MAPEERRIPAFRECWLGKEASESATDYQLLAEHDGAFVARSRAGLAALVLPIAVLAPAATGRRASGCELVGHSSLRFVYRGSQWDGPAAALLCLDPDLVDTFAVLADDVLTRMSGVFTWPSIVALVEEWQTLLMPRGRPSKEAELGIWGELWFIVQSRDVNRTLSCWRGPDGDATDFFYGGVAVEVKASRTERQHFASQAQVEMPVGLHDSWLLSLWVKADPGSGVTVPAVVDAILARATDQAHALRRIAQSGYTPADRRDYTSGFTLLSEPEWFATPDVPRVRVADPGISQLRYRVVLDKARRAHAVTAERLWRHFHEHSYGSER
jgi:hypothetical protein